MFVKKTVPNDVTDIIQWLEEVFNKEKLVGIGKDGHYFLFLDFQKFCQASMVVQNTVVERMKRGK